MHINTWKLGVSAVQPSWARKARALKARVNATVISFLDRLRTCWKSKYIHNRADVPAKAWTPYSAQVKCGGALKAVCLVEFIFEDINAGHISIYTYEFDLGLFDWIYKFSFKRPGVYCENFRNFYNWCIIEYRCKRTYDVNVNNSSTASRYNRIAY